jgi:hypothetical protein
MEREVVVSTALEDAMLAQIADVEMRLFGRMA